jgi:hypothetical protein
MDASNKLDLSDIDWAEVPRHPMTPEALRCLRYFLITEGSTFFYTKALMKTKLGHRGARLRAVHQRVDVRRRVPRARVSGSFLEAYGERVEPDYRTRDVHDRRGVGERIDEIGQTRALAGVRRGVARGAHGVGRHPGDHDLPRRTTQLIERVNHPILTDDLPADHEAGAAALRLLRERKRARSGSPRRAFVAAR